MHPCRARWMAMAALAAAGAAWPLGCSKPTGGNQAKSAAPSPTYFKEITSSSGIDFQHWCGDGGKYFFPEVMGSGIALFDYDGDGDLDLYVVQGMPAKPTMAEEGDRVSSSKRSKTSRLYRREKDGRFTDVTTEAGLLDGEWHGEPYGMGVAVGDVNNDGWPDLYETKFGRDRLYLNRQGRFEDVTEQAGIDNPRWGTSACFVDYDRDGWLDLFVANYVDYFPSQDCIDPSGRQDYCHPTLFADAPAKLFRNVTGEAGTQSNEPGANSPASPPRFRDVSLEMGIDDSPGPGLGVVPGDFNADGWPDLYVANDAKRNFLWMNQQGKTFLDEAIPAGAAYDQAGKPQSSMGVASGDVDRNGHSDLFMTHLDGEYSTLYLQIEGGIYEDRTVAVGLAQATIPYTGFGTALVDVDVDGDLDLLIANGRVRRRDSDRDSPAEPAAFWQRYAEHNQIFLGAGDGTFAEVSPSKQPFCAEARVFRGLAVGDLDADGDLDVVTSEVNGPARIFRNVAPRQGNWLLIKAVDPKLGGRDAYGAQVTVVAGGQRWSREINPAFSYLSSSDPRAHFGLGKRASIDQVQIRWPDGTEERFPGGAVNRSLTVRRGEGASP